MSYSWNLNTHQVVRDSRGMLDIVTLFNLDPDLCIRRQSITPKALCKGPPSINQLISPSFL